MLARLPSRRESASYGSTLVPSRRSHWGFGFALAGALPGGVSRLLIVAGLAAAGLAWIVSGVVAWQSGMHIFGGARTGGFMSQYVITTRSSGGARFSGALLIGLGLASFVAAVGARP